MREIYPLDVLVQWFSTAQAAESQSVLSHLRLRSVSVSAFEEDRSAVSVSSRKTTTSAQPINPISQEL